MGYWMLLLGSCQVKQGFQRRRGRHLEGKAIEMTEALSICVLSLSKNDIFRDGVDFAIRG
jgi:hypothetical protein